MSVLVCGGKLTYPIKVSTDKLGIIGVSYVDQLTDYLKYNQQIDKLIFLETVDNEFKEEDLEGFTGDISMITNNPDKYKAWDSDDVEVTEEQQESEEFTEEEERTSYLTGSTLEKIKDVKELEGLRISDIQWEIMNS